MDDGTTTPADPRRRRGVVLATALLTFASLLAVSNPPAPGSPKECWDRWGYLGPRHTDYATKRGSQMRTVMNMVRALGG